MIPVVTDRACLALLALGWFHEMMISHRCDSVTSGIGAMINGAPVSAVPIATILGQFKGHADERTRYISLELEVALSTKSLIQLP